MLHGDMLIVASEAAVSPTILKIQCALHVQNKAE